MIKNGSSIASHVEESFFSVLRMNVMIFAGGFLLMSAIAAIGSRTGEPRAAVVVDPVAPAVAAVGDLPECSPERDASSRGQGAPSRISR